MKLKTGWLNETNSKWEIANPKLLFTERSQRSLLSDVHLTPSQIYGVLPQTEYMEITGTKVVLNLSGLDNMKHVEPDDFIIHLRSFQGGIEHSRFSGKVSNAYCVLIPSKKVEPRYFRWVLKSKGFIQELSSTTDQLRDGQSIKFEQFAGIGLPLPTLKEQIEIADYLDVQMAHLDSLVAARKGQILQLQEFRKALQEQTVFGSEVLCEPIGITTSSDLAEPFRDKMPPCWKRTQFRYVTTPTSRASGGSGDLLSVYLNEGVIPFAQGGEDRVHNPSEDMSKYQIVEKGNLVMNNQQAWRGSVGVSTLEGIISPAYHIYRLSEDLLPDYANLLFRSRPMVFLYEQVSRGVGNIQRNLDSSSLRNIPVVYPEISIQTEIVEEYKRITLPVQEAIMRMNQSISLYEEYRASLITSAVTGIFDVRSRKEVA